MLLTSKYSLPECPDRAVVPAAALQKVAHSEGVNLVYINASAGYGKTTFLAKWVESIDWPVAWVSLDESDDNVAQFVEYLVTSINYATAKGCENSLNLIQHNGTPGITPVLDALTEDLHEFNSPLLIVLDDFHCISEPGILKGLSRFLDYLPEPVVLAIASREACPFPISSLRVRNKLVELDHADLALSQTDVQDYLQAQFNFELPKLALQSISDITEGWATAVQLVSQAAQSLEEVSALVEELKTGHRHLIDYLSEEVMQRLDETTKQFLLKISVLNRFNAEMAAALSDQPDAQTVLERIERDGIFVVPLDRTRTWYRFHPLFHSFLQHQAKLASIDLRKSHLIAAEAWLSQSMPLEALNHARSAGDKDLTVKLLAQHGFDLYQSGQQRLLSPILSWLGDDGIMSDDELTLLAIEVARHECDYDRVDQLYYQVMRAAPGNDPNRKSFIGRLQVTVALSAMNQAQFNKARQYAQSALEGLLEGYSDTEATAKMVVGGSAFCTGDLENALQIIDSVEYLAKRENKNHLVIHAYCVQSDILTAKGELQNAYNIQSKALKFAQHQHLLASNELTFVYRLRAQLFWEWYALDDVEHAVDKSLELNQPRGERFCLQDYALLLQLAVVRGQSEDCAFYSEKMQELLNTDHLHLDWYANMVSALLFYWHAVDDQFGMDQWLKSSRPTSGHANHFEQNHARNLAWATALLGDPDAGLALLQPNLEEADNLGLIFPQMRNHIVAAGLEWLRDDRARSIDILRVALQSAMATGAVSSFFILGKRLLVMLDYLRSERSLSPLETKMVDELTAHVKAQPKLKKTATIKIDEVRLEEIISCESLPEWFHASPLTVREWQVFNLIHLGLTNENIAGELGISPTTIKTHIRHIYRKLDVADRREAVSLAEQILAEIEGS